MASEDAIWLDVLPSMRGFAPALAAGAGKAADVEGKKFGAKFGKVALAGAATIATGAALATKALYSIGETFDDVTDTIRVGTGATGAALDELTKSAKKVGTQVPADFADIGTTIADVNTRLGLTGPVLEKVSSQFLELGRITGEKIDIQSATKALSGFGIEGESVSGALDHLYRVSQASGVSIGDLTKQLGTSGAVVKQLGLSFEQATVLIGSLDKAGLNSNQVMAALSRSMVTLAKDGEKPADAFKRVTGEMESLLKRGKESQAIDLAGKMFGTRGAPQLIAALKSGAISFADLDKMAGQTGDTILGAGKDTADFAEHWKLFKNRVLVALEPLATRVFGLIGNAMDRIGTAAAPALKKVEGALAELTGGFTAFAVAFRKGDGDITSAGFPGWMEKIAFPIRQAFDGLRQAWAGFVEGFGGWDSIVETFKGVVPLLTGPLGLIKSSLAGAFGGADMGALGESVGKNVKPLLESLAKLGASAVGAIAKVVPPLLAAAQKLMPIVGRLATKLVDVATKALPPLTDLLGKLVGLIGDELVQALEDFTPLIEGAFTFLGETVEGAATTLSGVVEFISGAFAGDWGKAWGGIEKATEGYWQQIGALPKAIVGEALKGFGITEDVDSIMKRGTDRFFELIGQWWTDVTTWFSSTWTGITEFVSRPFLDAANAAKPMVDGIIGFVRWGLGVFDTAWKTITTLIMIPIKLAEKGLGAAWNFITTRIFQSAWNWISRTFIGAWRLLSSWLSGPINTAKNAISAAWNFITKGIFQSAWNWISGTFRGAWDRLSGWLSGPVNTGKSGIATALGGIEGLFRGALKSIETIWNGLQGVIKAPIRWAIDRINDLLGIIRDVGGKVGIDSKSLPGNIGYPPGFDGGGWTGPGPRMKPAGIVHADEFVISKPARRKFEQRHPGALTHINLYGELPGYVGGGRVPDPGRVSSVSSYRPVPGGWTTYAGHRGIDFPVAYGTPIRAWRLGRVRQVLNMHPSWGNYVQVDHGGGLWSAYAHLSRILASVGQVLGGGQTLGYVGSTGRSTGPHLHWEIWRNGTRAFPAPYLTGSAIPPAGGGLPGMTKGTGTNPVGDIVKGLLSPLLSPLMGLKAPFPGVFGQLMSAVPGFLGKKALDGAANIFKFDDGGQLQPGLTLAYNATSRPEPVLTGRQWDQLASGRDRVTAADIRRALDGMRIDLDNGRLWFDRHASARERAANLARRTAS